MINVAKLNKKEQKLQKEVKKLDKEVKQVKKQKSRKRGAVKEFFENQQYGDSRDYTNPLQFRQATPAQLMREMSIYHKHVRDRYYAGLIHPDLAVKNQIPLKLYSDVPIPTAAIGFHEQLQFTTSSQGTFLLSWRPNYLVTQGYLTTNSLTGAGQLTFNNSSSLTGAVGVSGNNFVAKTFYPSVSIQRYRLVSALLRVTYNGSVLNQSGTMISCATFDKLYGALGTAASPVTTQADSLVDRFGAFTLITNGLWNSTANVAKTEEGLDCLYVPCDPDDYVFGFADTYYHQTPSPAAGLIGNDGEGAHINYIIAGRNLPASTSCIIADIYYNYEVIADPSAAPVMRSSVDMAISKKDHEGMMDVISDVVKNGNLIKPTEQGPTWAQTLAQVAKYGLSYISKALL